MRHVQSTKELDESGEAVREVIFPGDLLSRQDDLIVMSMVEKLSKDGVDISPTKEVIDGLDFQDGDLLIKKAKESFEQLKKKLSK